MSDDPGRPAPPPSLLKAASEPDLSALPHTSSSPPRSPPPPPLPPPLALPPPSPLASPRASAVLAPPDLAPATAVSFSEYVASELAGDTALGVSFAPAAPAPSPSDPPPSSPRPLRTSPRASPRTARASPPRGSPRAPRHTPPRGSPLASSSAIGDPTPADPDEDPAAVPSPADPDAPRGAPTLPRLELRFADELSQQPSEEPTFQSGGMGRYGKLACVQVNGKGEVEERELTRAEILQEARETLSKSQPSPKAIGRWLSSTAAAQSPTPEMREFTSFLQPGSVASRKATQKALRDYLRNSLQARDIRQVDPAFVAKPALWVRHSALVVSLEGLRAIILHNKMFVFDPTKERSRNLVLIARQSILARPDAEQQQPFEFRALEGILIFVSMGMEREFTSLKPGIEMYLHQLPNELTTKMLEELRRKKQQLNHFHSRASNVKTILENLLDEDEEMANMYLTEKHESHDYGGRSSVDHNEVETLLEAYLQVIDDHVNQSMLLNAQIDDTEDLVMIHLDTLRNRLLSVELALSVVSMTFGVGGVISGVFGMNMQIPLFEASASRYWFWATVSVILVMVVAVSWRVLVALRRRGLYSFY